MDLDGDEAPRHRVQGHRDDLGIADKVVGQADKAVSLAADMLDDIRRQKEADADVHDEAGQLGHDVDGKLGVPVHAGRFFYA